MAVTRSRTKTKHLGIVRVLLCVSVVCLLGCQSALEPTPQPASITFVYGRDLADHIETVIPKFSELYPHITVDLQAASDGELAWDFGAEDADVRAVFTAIVDSQRERGDFLPLDAFIEADALLDVSDFYDAALEAFTIDGHTWAIPYGVTSEVFYYNKDLFDHYGVAYPQIGWTWDDLVDTASALRDPQAGIYGFAHSPDADGWFQWGCIHQNGGRLLDDMEDPTRVTFDDPLNIEAVEWYASLYHEYGVAPAQKQVQAELGGDIDVAFAQGKVGMTIRDLSCQTGVCTGLGWPERWGMVPPPRSTSDTALDISGDLWVNGYAISSQTQHPEDAWQLVAFMSRQITPRQIPPRRSYIESGEYGKLVGSEAAAVAQHVLQYGRPWPNRKFLDITLQAIVILGEATAKVRSGEMTSQEAMNWAQQQAENRIVIAATP